VTLTPVLTEHWDEPDSYTIDGYRRHGGYDALRAALEMAPDDVIGLVKKTGLRGRGGAGFPTGMKWSFVPQNDGKPHYLVINADESEPGACKDIPLMMANPHSLIEGIAIASWAIRANHAFVYIRGEVPHVVRRVTKAVRDAYAAGFLGKKGLAPTFVVKRLHYLIPWKAVAANRVLSRHFLRSLGCTPVRRWSTTSRRSRISRTSLPMGLTGSANSGPRSHPGTSCSHCQATSSILGFMKPHLG